MRYLNSNLAREVSRLARWSDGIWSRRYQAIVVSSEEEAQVARSMGLGWALSFSTPNGHGMPGTHERRFEHRYHYFARHDICNGQSEHLANC